jgi:hypothetical protein
MTPFLFLLIRLTDGTAIIDLAGSYQPTIDLAGSHQPVVEIAVAGDENG